MMCVERVRWWRVKGHHCEAGSLFPPVQILELERRSPSSRGKLFTCWAISLVLILILLFNSAFIATLRNSMLGVIKDTKFKQVK